MWVKLENHFRGSGAVVLYNAVSNWYDIKYNDYANLSEFTIAFSKNIDRLRALNAPVTPEQVPITFIMKVASAFPIWAERQRAQLRNPDTVVTLTSLIDDLTDEARKNKSSSAHYSGKPQKPKNSNPKKPDNKKNNKNKDKSKEKEEPREYKKQEP